jgi:Tol biopolymer transport system component
MAADGAFDVEASSREASTPASLLLAFISDRAGTNDLYTARGDGSDLRARVVGPGNEAFPVFTSDGAGIVYWSDREGTSALYRHDLATDVDTKYATDVPALDGALSPDGSTLAFESREVDGDAAVFDAIRTAPAIGGASKLLTMPGESWAAPLFLPSGEILFVRGASSGYVVATMNVDGSALTNLPLSQAPTGRVGVSATGRTIAYDAAVTIDDAGDTSSRVILFDVATGVETALPVQGDSAPVIARDDRTVAAVTTRYGSIDIVLMDASGTLLSRLTGASGSEGTNTDPAFAP